MIVGGIALLLALVLRPVGQVLGWIAWVFLTYTIEMVRLTARVPFASIPVKMEGWMVWGYYGLLAGLTWWFNQTKERRRELWDRVTGALRSHLQTRMIAGVTVVLLVMAFAFWHGLPDGRLHVVFLDVGQGDAIFIETPSGKQVLIDGGPSETQVLAQLGNQMGFWDRTLDLVVLTHPDADHVNGLVPVLERYQVAAVLHRRIELDSETYAYWLALVEAEGAAVYDGQAGLSLTLDPADARRPGLEMTVLHPGAEEWEGANDNSVVTRLTYGSVSLLLTGDIEAEVEEELVGAGSIRESTLLKLAHHGSCGSSTPEFLDAVDPEVVVVSVGADNHFGHPCAEVLERLDGLPVFRTDEHGAVEIISDGTRVWVEVER